MMLLKPRWLLRRRAFVAQQFINAFAEVGVGEHAFEFIAGDGLQDHPRVLCEFPQCRIKLPPQLVGGVIPRPEHVQGKFRQKFESLDLRGQETVERIADSCLLVHDLGSFHLATNRQREQPGQGRMAQLGFPS